MPIVTGTIAGQNIGYRIVDAGKDGHVDEVTMNLSFRDITADAALTLYSHHRKEAYADCGFSSVQSAENGYEEFDPPLPRIRRNGVAFLTFRTAARRCSVRSRWVINYWE